MERTRRASFESLESRTMLSGGGVSQAPLLSSTSGNLAQSDSRQETADSGHHGEGSYQGARGDGSREQSGPGLSQGQPLGNPPPAATPAPDPGLAASNPTGGNLGQSGGGNLATGSLLGGGAVPAQISNQTSAATAPANRTAGSLTADMMVAAVEGQLATSDATQAATVDAPEAGTEHINGDDDSDELDGELASEAAPYDDDFAVLSDDDTTLSTELDEDAMSMADALHKDMAFALAEDDLEGLACGDHAEREEYGETQSATGDPRDCNESNHTSDHSRRDDSNPREPLLDGESDSFGQPNDAIGADTVEDLLAQDVALAIHTSDRATIPTRQSGEGCRNDSGQSGDRDFP